MEPTARGDPLSPLRWPGKRTRRVATALGQQGHHVRHPPVGQRRKALHDRLPGPRNTREGTSPPDRQAPLASINAPVKDVQPRGPPVGSVDTQNKAWGGDVAHGGRADHPPGRPEPVRGPAFLDKRWGPAIPSGVSAMTQNWGGVSVGVDHDPAAFAVATVQPWWPRRGQALHPPAQHVLMTAAGGGSHGRRARRWKVAWPRLSDTTGWDVGVGHGPPGTSQGNQIEPRLFGHITETWRGRPLVSPEVRVNLLAHPTPEPGLRVAAALDPTSYPTGHKGSDEARAPVNFSPAACPGDEWNSGLKPRGNNQ